MCGKTEEEVCGCCWVAEELMFSAFSADNNRGAKLNKVPGVKACPAYPFNTSTGHYSTGITLHRAQ